MNNMVCCVKCELRPIHFSVKIRGPCMDVLPELAEISLEPPIITQNLMIDVPGHSESPRAFSCVPASI